MTVISMLKRRGRNACLEMAQTCQISVGIMCSMLTLDVYHMLGVNDVINPHFPMFSPMCGLPGEGHRYIHCMEVEGQEYGHAGQQHTGLTERQPAWSAKRLWGHSRQFIRTRRPIMRRFLTLSTLNFLAAGIFFLTQTTIANVIGRTQFGMLAYGIALGIYGQTIVGYGQERSLVRDLVQQPDRFHPLVMGSLVLRAVLLGMVIAVLLLWRLIDPTTLSWGVIVITLAYTLKSLDLQAVYDTWRAMGRHAAYALLQRLLYVAMIWLLLWLCHVRLTLMIVGLVLLASQMIYLVIQQRWVFRRLARQTAEAISSREVLRQARSGIWLFISLLLTAALLSTNQILLKHYVGAHELGGYAAAWQVTMFIVLLSQYAARVGGPRLAAVTHEYADYRRQLRFLLGYALTMVLLVLPFVGVFLFYPERLMHLFFSAEYHGEEKILFPLGIYALLNAPGLAFEQYIIASRMEFSLFLSMFLGGLTCFILGVLVIPHAGGYGAGWVLAVSYGMALCVYVIAITLHLRRMARGGTPSAAVDGAPSGSEDTAIGNPDPC